MWRDPPTGPPDSARQLVAVLEATTDLVATLEAAGRLLYLNPAGRRLLGLDVDRDVRDLRVGDLFPERLRAQVLDEALPAAIRAGAWSGETVLAAAGGREIPVSIVFLAHKAPDGTVEFLSAIARDIAAHKRLEEELLHLANHDDLTGLLNRRRFQQELERELAQARRYGTHGALLFVDFDNFKAVNDSLGHRVGDQMLVRLAGLLREQLRETDVPARLGGDEFAVLMPHTGPEEAEIAARRILKAVREHRTVVGEQAVGVTASIGIAVYPEHGTTAEELLTRADHAVYEAKKTGDRHCVYAPGEGPHQPIGGPRPQPPRTPGSPELDSLWASGLARGLIAPVSALRRAVDALAGRPPDAGEIADAARLELSRLERVVQALHVVADLDRVGPRTLEPVPAQDLLLQAAESLKDRADAQGVRFFVPTGRPALPGQETPGGQPVGDWLVVTAHPALLRQAFSFLLENALDAMPGGGLILLDWTAEEDGVRLDVIDSGPGIDPEVQGRVFEPFFTTRPDRLGVGLTLCQAIVRAHGGTVRLGAGVAGGVRASVFLPRRRPGGTGPRPAGMAGGQEPASAAESARARLELYRLVDALGPEDVPVARRFLELLSRADGP
ncbi:diguanylate cyclase domain-containing protein [Caldinitratiruptor microaerophilus]|uniref:histidine kinase n=1 Tax=Caldinitratiruptor microaerophilus TaxID=671077 RepID=A0AA35CIA1_9FIRM|nr:diguanylate cyclase [Caldinitratiruptor microaerophilus]BDG59595.1 hypothetical protein caldi_06850 [Caldinitratiruptor microaerophilus]